MNSDERDYAAATAPGAQALVECPVCEGQGVIYFKPPFSWMPETPYDAEKPCGDCQGSGSVPLWWAAKLRKQLERKRLVEQRRLAGWNR